MRQRSLAHLVSALNHPLAIERRTLDKLMAMLRRAQSGEQFTGVEIHDDLGIPEPREPRETNSVKRVAVIPVVGVIAARIHSLGASTQAIGRAFMAAMADRKIDAIVFDVDSPGGSAFGVPELAEMVYVARGRAEKPVVAVANDGMMASAAYWISSVADEIVVSPSSLTGSIGVFMVHEDMRGWLDKEGVVVTEISAGKFKTEGAPWKALSEEAQARFQSEVDAVYDQFVRAVALGRAVTPDQVRNGFGEGRVVMADEAVSLGLADRVGTLDETIARVAEERPRRRTVATARRRAALDALARDM